MAKIHTENIYPGETPRLNYVFKDVEMRVNDEITITGVARVGSEGAHVLVVRYRHKNHIHIAFIPRGDIAHVAELIIDDDKKLKNFAEQLADELRDLPVEIKITKNPPYVYASLLRRVDKEAFQRYVNTCKQRGMKYEPAGPYWRWTPA